LQEVVRENEPALLSDSHATDQEPLASRVEPPSPTSVEKFEYESGEHRVNVRIFREPAQKPATPEPQEDGKPEEESADILLVRLRDDFHETPIQPNALDHDSERIKLVDD
jgi:hypothetical protein